MNARKLFKVLLILVALIALSKAVKAVTALAPEQVDLTPSHKSASPQYALQGKRITYTVVISNNTGPLPDTILLTDTIPIGLSYVPGTLTATTGVVSDADAPTLSWSGSLSPDPTVTVTYVVTASAAVPQYITNTAIIAAPGSEDIVCTATVIALGSGPSAQPASLIYDEMRTVYLGNLARRDNGVPPLRWNAQMTDAARWFSWDSVDNRPGGYCGHDDTLGLAPWDRVPFFGYKGFVGAENCFCGYVTPESAIEGWMNSEGHRANLLNDSHREIGLGYYRRESDGRGYVTQDFGHDGVYPPVIIENEALTTSSTVVDLYVYGGEEAGGFTGMGPTTEMMVSNDACFTDASWEPYTAEKAWSLEAGTGWRTVYVKLRDAMSRTAVISDTIYLGGNIPLDDLGLHLASTTTDRVTLYGLAGEGLPYVHFSQNWFADDTFDTFGLLWGEGEQVDDPDALGGTAFRLCPDDIESSAWVWTTSFFKDTPLVAYFRLKVDDNTSADEVARISVKGGDTEYGPSSLKGTDFAAPNTYQEFPVAFVFHDNPEDVFLTFQFWRSGEADVYVDGVYIFTDPQPVQSPLTWTVPGGNYRGGGIQLRYTDGADTFSPIEEADLIPERLTVRPSSLQFLVEQSDLPPAAQTLTVVQEGCEPFTWTLAEDASWLSAEPDGETITVSVDAAGLVSGTYHATVTIEAEAGVLGSPALVPVTLTVSEPPPVADFTAAPLTGRPPLTVAFTDTSTGGLVTGWEWEFGDEGVSTIQHPTHTYELTGTFTVSLTVAGPGGSDTEVKAKYIKVSDKPIIANFNAHPTEGVAPLTVQFTDTSSGEITSWLWDFGAGSPTDEITSTLQSPTHTYTHAGTFTVSLRIEGLEGYDTEVKAGYITVAEWYDVYLPLVLRGQ